MWHLSCYVLDNVYKNCRLFLLSQFFTSTIFSVCCMLYDLNTLFTSNLNFLSSLYLSSASQLNVGCFIMGLHILAPHFVFLHVLGCFLLWPQPWLILPVLLLQLLPALLLQQYLSAQLSSSVFVFYLLVYCIIAYVCLLVYF